MKLFDRDLGGAGKPPLIILHGLLGSSRNWRTAGADLAACFHVHALDLRNHGQSPHAAEHSFELMAADILDWLDDRRMARAHILGHSLGGKVAMQIACRAQGRVAGLCVVDIAPRPYAVDSRAFAALTRLDLKGLVSRRTADERLAGDIPDRGMRQFLLTNLVRTETGGLAWQANLPVLESSLAGMRKSSLAAQDRFDGTTLFIAGGKSAFVREEDFPLIRRHFPRARIEVMASAGHYPHVGDRKGFVGVVSRLMAPP